MPALSRTWFTALLLAIALPAQAPAAVTVRQEAEAAFAEREWQKAADAYRKLPDAQSDIVACHHIGYCLHALGKLDEALPWHERAAALRDKDPLLGAKATYNIACVRALQGDKDAAIAMLKLTAERGFRNAGFLLHDQDLVSLRDDQRFLDLIAAMQAQVEAQAKVVAIVVHQGVEVLDFAGPVEVFGSARGPGGDNLYRVVLVAPQNQPVHPAGLSATVTPDYGIADCPQPAVLVVPGGDTSVLEKDAAFVAWVQKVAPKCDVVLSVCTGAFVLAKAGLLDGKAATTFHGAQQGLKKQYPGVTVQAGVKYVDSGQCVTAAGVSSGIEGALHVVERLQGEKCARAVADYMEYAWPRPEPPAAAK
jgi:putative intracellular protease/amidase